MYIGDKWYTDAELTAHVLQLQNAVHAAARIIECALEYVEQHK